MSTTLATIIAKVAEEYSGLGRVGACTSAGSATTLVDARHFGTYGLNVKKGSPLVLKFTKTATTIAFVVGGANNDSITDSGNGLGSYRVGDTVMVSGAVAAGNNSSFVILTVAAGTLGVATGSLTTGAAGPSITLTTYEWNGVTDFAQATGTITFYPGGNTSATGHTFQVWEPEVEHEDLVKQAINRALRTKCWYWRLVPVSMLADGDCQATTGWSTLTTNHALVALAYPCRFGRYYLSVTPTSADGYAFQSLRVTAGDTWEIATIMRAAALTTGYIDIYDTVNAAVITPSGDTLSVTGLTSSGSNWQFLKASFTIPTGCDRIHIRLRNNTASGATYFGWVLAWPHATQTLPRPDRVISENMVGRAFRVNGHLNIDSPESWYRDEDETASVERQSVGGLSLSFDSNVGSALPMYEEMTFYVEMASETSTTDCDADWLAAQASLELVSRIVRRQEVQRGMKAAEPWQNLEMRCFADANERARFNTKRPPLRMITKRR